MCGVLNSINMTEERSSASHLSIAMTTTSMTHVTGGTVSSRGVEFYFQCAVLLVGVVGTAANGLVLYALVASKQHKKLPLIINQNVLDLSSSFVMIITYLMKLCNPYLTGSFGKFLCVLLVTDNLIWWANSGAIVNLAVITVERYLKVVYAVWSKNRLRKWLIHVAMVIPWVVASVSCVANVASRYPGSDVIEGVCYSRIVFVSKTARVIYIIWDLLSFYFIVIIIFIFCYTLILVAVRRQARVMAGHSAAAQAHSNQIQTNVIKTMVLVGALYTISWATMYISGILVYLYPYPLPRDRMYYTTVLLGYSYMCTNPFIYATKFDPVKQVLLRMTH